MGRALTSRLEKASTVRGKAECKQVELLRFDSETGELESIGLLERCEQRGHPRSRFAHDECICGLMRYDD